MSTTVLLGQRRGRQRADGPTLISRPRAHLSDRASAATSASFLMVRQCPHFRAMTTLALSFNDKLYVALSAEKTIWRDLIGENF